MTKKYQHKKLKWVGLKDNIIVDLSQLENQPVSENITYVKPNEDTIYGLNHNIDTNQKIYCSTTLGNKICNEYNDYRCENSVKHVDNKCVNDTYIIMLRCESPIRTYCHCKGVHTHNEENLEGTIYYPTELLKSFSNELDITVQNLDILRKYIKENMDLLYVKLFKYNYQPCKLENITIVYNQRFVDGSYELNNKPDSGEFRVIHNLAHQLDTEDNYSWVFLFGKLRTLVIPHHKIWTIEEIEFEISKLMDAEIKYNEILNSTIDWCIKTNTRTYKELYKYLKMNHKPISIWEDIKIIDKYEVEEWSTEEFCKEDLREELESFIRSFLCNSFKD